MTVLSKSITVCLLLAGLYLQAPALVIVGGDTGHTNAPADDPGWRNVGSVRGHYKDSNGIWRASPSRAGVIYLCDDWFLTTYHAWWYDNPTGVVVGTTGYTVITNSLIRLTNNITGFDTRADVAMFRVTETPNLPPLNLTTAYPGGLNYPIRYQRNEIIMIGNGHPRVDSVSYWDAAWSNATPTNAVYSGYKFWPDTSRNILRWGSNQIDTSESNIDYKQTMPEPFGDIVAVQTVFNTNAGPDECQIAPIDSGGAVFYKKSGYWELTGLMSTMIQPDGSDPKTVWGIADGGRSIIVDLSYYREQIMQILKPEGWPDLQVVTPALTYNMHPGASVSIPIVTKNQGAIAATNFITALYLVESGGANSIVDESICSKLGVGESFTNTFKFTVPSKTNLYYLVAKADNGTNAYQTDDGTVHESYENNNQSAPRQLNVIPLYTFVTNNGAITITRYLGSGGTVTIPDAINGLSVTEIGTNSFENCTTLTRLIMPDTVTIIGDQAFQSCTGLTSIVLSTNLTTLGYGGIGAGAFRDCSSLTQITIPSSVTSMQNWAFAGCTSLTTALIENDIVGIGMFAGCVSLSKITLSDTITQIGSWAFSNCTGLTSLYFRGETPIPGDDIFSGVSGTIYHMPGKTSWPVSTWEGLPVALWEPMIISAGIHFGMQANQFGFDYTWASGQVVIVEAATNLTGSWFPIQTNTLYNDEPVYFSDPQTTNHPGRFYRLTF